MIRGSLIFQKIREISRKFFGPGVAGSSSIVGWVGDNNQWMYYISCEIGFVKFSITINMVVFIEHTLSAHTLFMCGRGTEYISWAG